ncbi:ABC transporter substrate-binding protein [Ensifer canadensis]
MSKRNHFLKAMMLASAVALPAVASAQDITVPQALKDKGSLVVGIESSYPPMAYRDTATNERIGLNIDLVTAIGKKLGVEVQWEEMGFEQLMTSVETGRIDMIGAAISDLPKRREKMTFVDYLVTGAQPFTLTANAQSLKTNDDLCGKRVGAPSFTSYFPEAKKWSDKNCVNAGKPAMTVNGTNGATATRLDLKQGRLDAGVLGPEFVVHLMRDEPNTYALVGEPLLTTLFGLAFKKEDTAARDAVAQAIDALIADGTYAEILKKYGLEKWAMASTKIDAGN